MAPRELVISADVLAPERIQIITISGQKISKVLRVIPAIMKDIFKLESSAFYEDEMKFDTSGDPINFYGKWRGRVRKDERTTTWYTIIVQGSESKKDGNGTTEVRMIGTITTKLPYDNPLQIAASQAYLYFSYKEQRRKYIVDSKRMLLDFDKEVRREFGVVGAET